MSGHTFEHFARVAEAYRRALLALDPPVFDGAGCEGLLTVVTRVKRAEAVAEARLARRATEANRWLASGDRSPGDWFARSTGTTPGRARRELGVADDLAAAPATEQALAEGRVSIEQAAEIAAAARVDPASEARLLAVAPTESLAGLQRRARKVRAAATDEAARREQIRRRRHLRHWTDAEGAFCFAGRGLPEDGAALLAALKPHRDAAFNAARQAGQHEPSDAYAYDALLHLITGPPATARRATTPTRPEVFEGDAHAGPPTPPTPTSRPGTTTGPTIDPTVGPTIGPGAAAGPSPATGAGAGAGAATGAGAGVGAGPDVGAAATTATHSERRAGEGATATEVDGCGRDGGGRSRPESPARAPARIILTADLSAMARGHTVPGETCEIAGIGPVAVAAARDLLGDAFLALVLTDGVDIRNVTHLGRAPTAHQRTALEARGRVCAVPGCGRTVGLEIDHVDGWAVTRRTHIDQLDWLCGGVGGHHHRKTHDGWTLAGPPGNRTWHPPRPHRRTGSDPVAESGAHHEGDELQLDSATPPDPRRGPQPQPSPPGDAPQLDLNDNP